MGLCLQRCALLAFTLCVLGWSPSFALGDDEASPACPVEPHWEEVRAGYAKDLRAKAKVLHKMGCYGLRDDLYARLITVAPDDKEARKWLKFRLKDGAWVRGRYNRPRGGSKKALAQGATIVAGVDAAWLAQREALVHRARTVADHQFLERAFLDVDGDGAAQAPLLRGLRMNLYVLAREAAALDVMATSQQALLESHGDDTEVRRILGHELHEGVYVLRETARAHKRRAALAELAKKAREDLPDGTTRELTSDEIGLGLVDWASVEAGAVHVAGTQKVEALLALARELVAGAAFFDAVLDVSTRRRPWTKANVFASHEDYGSFLERWPTRNKEALAAQREASLHVLWVDDRIAVSPVGVAGERDLALGMVLTVLAADTWTKDGVLPGWVDEGITRYVVWRFLGTRFTMSVATRYAGDSSGRTAIAPEANWFALAQKELEKNAALDLRLLLGKGVDAYSTRDALLVFAFAAFLVEGHAEQVAAFTKRTIAGEDLATVCKETLGDALPIVTLRFKTWLSEIAGS